LLLHSFWELGPLAGAIGASFVIMGRRALPASRPPAPGDIAVTKVANRYHIGQVHADRDVLTAITMRTDRGDALALACRFVMGRQRVFLYDDAGSRDFVEIDCATLTDKY
jgi:hypothetical protein